MSADRRRLTLTRSWDSRVTVGDKSAMGVEHDTVAGFPCPPPDALAALRRRVHDQRTPASDPIRWWHADGAAWAAVTDLHRRGEHGDATSLALLLRWCETCYSHEQVQVWTLAEAARDDAARRADS